MDTCDPQIDAELFDNDMYESELINTIGLVINCVLVYGQNRINFGSFFPVLILLGSTLFVLSLKSPMPFSAKLLI